jgi:hypothetical protein
MKVKIEFTVEIDANAWRYKFDPKYEMVTEAEVRAHVKHIIETGIVNDLRREGLTISGS